MVDVVLFLGYAATVALIIMLWRRRRPGRSTVPGVLLALGAGLLWPVTMWIAVGLWWYWRRGQAETQPPTATASNPLLRVSAAGIVVVCVLGFVVTCGALGSMVEDPDGPTPSGGPDVTRSGAPTSSPTAVAPETAGEAVTVARIVDGDTVELADGRTVRVLGIDAPEVHNGTHCWGPESFQFAEDTLAEGPVRLVADPAQDVLDQDGRTLGYLVLPGSRNYSVLAAGAGAAFAHPDDQPGPLAPQIDAAQAQAQAAGRGVWGPPCFGTKGPLPAREPAPEPEPAPAPAPAPPAEPTSDCEPGYSPCVPTYPPDLNCADVNGPIIVTGSDPHGLDGDGDGRACE